MGDKEKYLASIPKADKPIDDAKQIDDLTILTWYARKDTLRHYGANLFGDWEPELSNKQIALSLVRERPIEEILRLKLEDFLETLEMKSLKDKIDRLHARCRPERDWSPMRGYAFDLARIEHLDLLRQNIVHGNALGQPIEDAAGEFDYMNRTCW
jgi:hypothetical protein